MQLDDELAKQLLSGCSGVDNLLEQMAEAQRTLTAQETADAVNQALTLAVANIADVEVPQSMVRETALNEYQAQLLRAQTEVALPPNVQGFSAEEWQPVCDCRALL